MPVDVESNADSLPSPVGALPPTKQSKTSEARLDALLERVAQAATGLCMRAFSETAGDPNAKQRTAEEIAGRAIAKVANSGGALKGSEDPDAAAQEVLRRCAVAALDELAGSADKAPLHPSVDLQAELPAGVPLDEIAPSSQISFSHLNEASAPARMSDRQVAFVVFAAQFSAEDASEMLGMSDQQVKASIHRTVRRLVESARSRQRELAPL